VLSLHSSESLLSRPRAAGNPPPLPVEKTKLYLIAGPTDERRLLFQLNHTVRWNGVVELGRRKLICLEILASTDPWPYFEADDVGIEKVLECEMDLEMPEKLFVLNFPEWVDFSFCTKLIRSITSTEREVVIQSNCQGLLIFKSSGRQPIMRYLKAIFENLAREPVTVVTRWEEVPIAHFANLPLEMDEDGFREAFGRFLPEGTRVIKLDGRDDHSRFHCIVRSGEDVWSLVETLRYGTVSDEEIRVSHFCPNDDLVSIKPWNLRISGVHKSLTLAELTSIFTEFGRILSVSTKEIRGDKVIVSIQYIDENGFERATREIPIRYPGLTVATPTENGFAVYNFRVGVTDREVRDLFKGANDVEIGLPSKPGQRPVVWVGYRSAEKCKEAMQEAENSFSDGCRLMCVPKSLEKAEAFALLNQKEREFQKEHTIYVANLPQTMTKEKLIDACRKFGQLNSCVVITRGARTFGVAAFETAQAYENACKQGLNLGTKRPTTVAPFRNGGP
jgi:hypothetical protein